MSEKSIFEKMKQERDSWLKANDRTIVKNKMTQSEIDKAKREGGNRYEKTFRYASFR